MIRSVPSTSFLALLVASAACGGSTKKPEASSDVAGGGGHDGGSEETAHADKDKESGDAGTAPAKKDECVGSDVANLEDMLIKSACEEDNVRPDALTPVDLKDKLVVTVTAGSTKLAPGGKSNLIVTFANKSKDPLILHFKIDPLPRFETEVWDATAKTPKRVDQPVGNTPPPPKNATQPHASEPKSARLTLAPGGTARAHVPWEAVKMKWAPEKFRGTPPERGFPRAPAGPLPKGKYSVKVVTPLIGVSDGVDHEMTAPKVEIEIGG